MSDADLLRQNEKLMRLQWDIIKSKDQSRLESFLEATLNVVSGFVISYAMWLWVVSPLFGIETHPGDSLLITGLFTLTSIIRSYLWRRFFNAGLHRLLQHVPSATDFSQE